MAIPKRLWARVDHRIPMTKSGRTPPPLAEKLLGFLANQQSQSAIIGDLEEEFSQIAENQGYVQALLWYWKLILISVPSFIKNRIKWSLTMFKNYSKIALRNIRRNKLFTFINLLGLAVGMACFILISLWVQDETSFDKFHEHKDSLYLLTIEHPNGILDSNVPYALAQVMAADFPEILQYTRIYGLGQTTCSFTYRPETGPPIRFYEDSVNLVDGAFFSMFSFPFVHGNPETALASANSLVITDKMAEKYFGRDNPLGKKLTFNNREDLIVSGVIQMPANSHLQLDFIALIDFDLANDWNWRDPAFIRLDDKTSLPEFQEKIAGTLNEKFPHQLPGTFKVKILPLEEVHLSFGRRIYVYIFSLIAIFILFIACINYMNLATANASSRTREVGLRKVVGAKRSQLIYQFLGESLLMSAAAFVVSLGLARALLFLLNSLTAKNLTLFSFHSPLFYGYLLGLILTVGIFSGSYPAFYLTSCKPIESLHATTKFRSNRSVFRVTTVVGQFTLSVLLIACTAVVFKQLHYIQNRPLGMKTDHVIRIRSNPALLRRFYSFQNELQNNPNILQITRGQADPFNEDYKTSGVDWDGKDTAMSPNIRYSITDFGFFETFAMEIVAGRSFSRKYRGDQRNYVINQAAAKYMGMENPLGQRLSFWGNEGQIIGVVKDFHHVSLHREIMPHIFVINPRFYSNWIKYVFIKIGSQNVPDTLRFIGDVSEKIAPDFPFAYTFLDQGIENLYESEQRLGKIFTYFAFLAIFISCLGILGLSAYTAEQRTKEIGIRKVLGSSAAGIVLLLSKQFSRWVLLANIIAWPAAYYLMHKWLQNFAYRTGLSLYLFALAGFLSFFIAALPTVYQSLKAAHTDPVETLRYE